ncbi:hypothetical protein ACFQ4Z_02745 [Oceanobacillus oncorhynchi subsp. oncorhynchi]|uniref:DUF1281 family ferredoxin-like fold protein n=1 Tax=Oceanobacillus oncorhynchi TaxID=545501 RepID=UPI00364127C0
MPNHISNKLKIIGSDSETKEVLDFVKIDEIGTGIDFNKITPMPKWIYGNSPDVIGIGLEDEKKWGKENTSLEWARNNWGTKWGAYGQPDNRNTEDTIYFQTAWNGVPNLIQKIAWLFPNVIVEYSFADEDLGSTNCGFYRFKENEILEEISYDFLSKEAYELAFELVEHGEVPHYYKFDENAGTYKIMDEYL